MFRGFHKELGQNEEPGKNLRISEIISIFLMMKHHELKTQPFIIMETNELPATTEKQPG